jgi:hypothetical protein
MACERKQKNKQFQTSKKILAKNNFTKKILITKPSQKKQNSIKKKIM